MAKTQGTQTQKQAEQGEEAVRPLTYDDLVRLAANMGLPAPPRPQAAPAPAVAQYPQAPAYQGQAPSPYAAPYPAPQQYPYPPQPGPTQPARGGFNIQRIVMLLAIVAVVGLFVLWLLGNSSSANPAETQGLKDQLNTTYTQLQTCNTDLGTMGSKFGTCQGDLVACTSQKDSLQTQTTICETAQASLTAQVFALNAS
ncbi:MAG: hypothetical protein WC759_00085, partial [Candidatus Micrarchaeia archaeon]